MAPSHYPNQCWLPIRAGVSTTWVLVLPKMINMNILKTLYSYYWSIDFPLCSILAPVLLPIPFDRKCARFVGEKLPFIIKFLKNFMHLPGDELKFDIFLMISHFVFQDLQHPNEFIRGSTLRFLCKLKEAELLEPLMPSIRSCLEHRHSYVRRNAVLAIYTIYRWVSQVLGLILG